MSATLFCAGDISIDKFYTDVLDTLSDEVLVKQLQNHQPSSFQNSRTQQRDSTSRALSILNYPFMLSPTVKQRVVHLSSVYKKMMHAQNPILHQFEARSFDQLNAPRQAYGIDFYGIGGKQLGYILTAVDLCTRETYMWHIKTREQKSICSLDMERVWKSVSLYGAMISMHQAWMASGAIGSVVTV